LIDADLGLCDQLTSLCREIDRLKCSLANPNPFDSPSQSEESFDALLPSISKKAQGGQPIGREQPANVGFQRQNSVRNLSSYKKLAKTSRAGRLKKRLFNFGSRMVAPAVSGADVPEEGKTGPSGLLFDIIDCGDQESPVDQVPVWTTPTFTGKHESQHSYDSGINFPSPSEEATFDSN